MSLDAIKAVASAEEMATRAVVEAKNKAKLTVTEAHQKAEEAYDAATRAIAAELAQHLGVARQEAAAIAHGEREKVLIECEEIQKIAQKRMDKAISIVVKKVVRG